MIQPANPAAAANRPVDKKQLRKAVDDYCRRVRRGLAELPNFAREN